MDVRITLRPWLAITFAAGTLCAQPAAYTVEANTKVPLALINSVSTKTAVSGERVYL